MPYKAGLAELAMTSQQIDGLAGADWVLGIVTAITIAVLLWATVAFAQETGCRSACNLTTLVNWRIV
jgi:hypothetical protein